VHGLGKKLIPISGQRFDIDGTGFDWPKTPASGCVFQIALGVCRSDENALAWLDDFSSPVARPVTLCPSRDECFEGCGFGLAQRRQFADLDVGPLDGRHLARDSGTRPRQAAAAQRPSDKSAVVPLHGGERRS
jgi:hypothetical protein